MKSIILISTMLFACHFAFSQCGKKTLISSSKTEYLDANGTLQKTVEENSLIEVSQSEVTIIPGSEDRKMTGVVVSNSCNWKTPFKEGKSIIKATFSKDGNTPMNATITIEGKDGNISFLMEIAERPDRKIRVLAEKFEEKQ